MPRYRQRPVYVEATQWFPNQPVEGVVQEDRLVDGRYVHAWIRTKTGVIQEVLRGDFIVVNKDGERWRIAENLFKTMYEPAVRLEPHQEVDIEDIFNESYRKVYGTGVEPIELDPEPQDISKGDTEILIKLVPGT